MAHHAESTAADVVPGAGAKVLESPGVFGNAVLGLPADVAIEAFYPLFCVVGHGPSGVGSADAKAAEDELEGVVERLIEAGSPQATTGRRVLGLDETVRNRP